MDKTDQGAHQNATIRPGQASAPDNKRLSFEREVSRLMNRLYGTALRLTRDPDDAEDVVAETVARAWKRLDQLEDVKYFEGWLFRILNHTFISLWRRRQCRQEKEEPLDDDNGETSFSLFEKLHQPFLLWWGTPEQVFLNGVLQQDINRALDSLPDQFRIVVVLVEIQGYSYDQASQILDVPLGTVRSRLSRARNLLQKALWVQGEEAGLIKGNQLVPGGVKR